MKQIWITKTGKTNSLTIREGRDPLPVNGQVRIRVERIGVSFPDVLGRQGAYTAAPSIPYIPGHEVVGVVDAITQGVTAVKEGDSVFAVPQFGGYTNVLCLPHEHVFKRLDWMSLNDAAALPINYLAAYQLLVVMGSLRPGDKLLIHNVESDIGLAAVDIGKLSGAIIYGSAPTAKHEFLQKRGIHHLIDPYRDDYEKTIMSLTNGRGVQLILDPAGRWGWRKNYRLLSATGRLVYCGVCGRPENRATAMRWWLRSVWPFHTPARLMNDNKVVAGANISHLWDYFERPRRWMAQIISWYDEALFRPAIDRTFKFEEADKALDFVQAKENEGKVLLTINN